MKRYLLVLAALFGLYSATQAQFVDFGAEYGFWKGDFAAGDIDDDGDLDVIFSGVDGVEKGAVMINDGNGNFTPQAGERIFKMGTGGNIKFGDIDGDGDLDVIFVGWGEGSSAEFRGIALNDGNGVYTFADREKYPVNTAAKVTSCGFADFNMDGLLDYYFFGNYKIIDEANDISEGNCIIYFQQPDGTFVAEASSFNDLRLNEPEVTIVDFDKDGTPDIFINAGNERATGTENKRFSFLFKNDGFGAFTQYAGVDVYRKKSNGTASWGDVNGDGYIDFMLNGDGYLNSGEDNDRIYRVYKNNGGLAVEVGFDFAEQEIGRQGSMANGSYIVDWNNDGKLDLITGGWNGTKQATELYLGDDPAAFTFTRSPLGDTDFPGVSEQAFRIADLNGDNKVDLLMSGYSGGTLEINRRVAGYVKNQSTTASVLPAAPTNLSAVVETEDGVVVTFSWEAPASETGKYGTTYNLSLKNKATGKWLYNPMAVVGGAKNGWRKVGGRMGNVYTNTVFYLYDLPDGEYEWTVQAINGAYLGGAFADVKTFKIGGGASVITPGYTAEPVISASNGVLRIQYDDVYADNTTLRVISANGAIVASQAFDANVAISLPAGVYIVELQQGKSGAYRTKIVM